MGDSKYDRWEFYPVLICEAFVFPFFFFVFFFSLMVAWWCGAVRSGCGVHETKVALWIGQPSAEPRGPK